MLRPRKLWMLTASLLMLLTLAVVALSSGMWRGRSNDEAGSLSGLVSANRPVVTEGQTAESQAAGVHPLDPLLEYAREIRRHMLDDVKDYTATLVKRERIRGSLGGESRMQLKVRNRQTGPDGILPLAA